MNHTWNTFLSLPNVLSSFNERTSHTFLQVYSILNPNWLFITSRNNILSISDVITACSIFSDLHGKKIINDSTNKISSRKPIWTFRYALRHKPNFHPSIENFYDLNKEDMLNHDYDYISDYRNQLIVEGAVWANGLCYVIRDNHDNDLKKMAPLFSYHLLECNLIIDKNTYETMSYPYKYITYEEFVSL